MSYRLASRKLGSNETTVGHCDVDLFLLQKNAGGWKIFSVDDVIAHFHEAVGEVRAAL